MKQEYVKSVEENSQPTSILQKELVQKNASINYAKIKKIRKIGKSDVYNMEVEGNHNFAINGGLVVHNCMDGTRYFTKTMRLVKPKSTYMGKFL